MNAHIAEIRGQIKEKENLLQELESKQSENWKTWEQSQKELSQIQINRERLGLNELRSEFNKTLVAYNEAKVVQQALPFGKRQFSVEKVEELQRRLAIPLSHDDVSTRQAPGRQDVVYIETFKALEKAQEVFGFDLGLEVRSEPAVLFQQNGKVVMKAIVRVTLANGCYHEDVGIGASMMNDPVEAVKMATKACVSDSIKRTLQHFGPALGSCLRDKEWVSTDLAPAVIASRGGGKTPRQSDDAAKRAKYSHGSHQNQAQNVPASVQPQSMNNTARSMHPPVYLPSSTATAGTVPAFNPPSISAPAPASAPPPSLISQQQATLALLERPSFEMPAQKAADLMKPQTMHHRQQQAYQNLSANLQQPPYRAEPQPGEIAHGNLPAHENEDDLARAYDEAMRAFCESSSTVS